MNKTFASISLNFVGDNNDSTIITFLSLGAIRACLKIMLFLIIDINHNMTNVKYTLLVK